MLRNLKARLKTADYYKMETIATVNAERDEKEMQISRNCLGVPTVLRHVLEQFSTKELVNFSLVNKLWNFEARSVMKERGNLKANISSTEVNICQQLAAFGSALENMRVIPFSRIYIHMHHHRPCQCLLDESVFKEFLNRLPLKHFAVSFCSEWKQYENCFALQFVTTILEKYCGVLEELSLAEGRYEFYQYILEDRRLLPCLKTLEVNPRELHQTNEPLATAFIRGLVARAPNLQELRIVGLINFKENVLQGSSAVLVPTRPFRPLVDQVWEGLIGSLRVSAMEIVTENEELDPELLTWFLPMVLAASRTTLKSLFVDQRFVLPLSYCGICFQNVTNLFIPLNGLYDNAEAATSELPTGLNFPKIRQAEILSSQERNYLWLSQSKTFP